MNNIMYNIFAFCTILLQTLTILINTVQNQTISDNMPQKYLLLYIILLTRLLAIKIASSSCSIQSSYSSSESSAAAPPLPASCHSRIPGSTGQESWPGPPGWQWPVVHTRWHYRHVWTTCVQPIWICVFVTRNDASKLEVLAPTWLMKQLEAAEHKPTETSHSSVLDHWHACSA